MKKLQIPTAILFITLAMFSCKNTEESENPEDKVVITDTLTSEKPNDLEGLIYRDITEIPQLKTYEHQAGSLIDTAKDSAGNYKYGLSQYGNDKNYFIVFQEIVREANNPKVKHKILDTLNIPKLNIDEHIATTSCRLNKIGDSEIIAIVKSQGSDDIEHYSNIVKAWRADTKTLKIIPIEDVKGIDCINEGYGL